MAKIVTNVFEPNGIFKNGNKFLIANGFYGYRGTLEEYDKRHNVGLNIAGLYDQVGDLWRESVNVFNPLYTYLVVDGVILMPQTITPIKHAQMLDLNNGTHRRETVYSIKNTELSITSQRFAMQTNLNLLVMKYQFRANADFSIELHTGIDADLYEINGPHLSNIRFSEQEDTFVYRAETQEKQLPIAVAETIEIDFPNGHTTINANDKAMRVYPLRMLANRTYTLTKYAYITHTNLASCQNAHRLVLNAKQRGYNDLEKTNQSFWRETWEKSDVEIEGDQEAAIGLQQSLYHLICIRPQSDFASVPARGLSGQVYKGAVFWDTEIFLMPFYLNTDWAAARHCVMYRINTLDGARRKAKQYGFQGAFFAWESQESGDDACSDYNVTDAQTGKPIRTYFKEKQIHITGDIVYALNQYLERTGDESVLLEGGLELLIEASRFYLSYLRIDLATGKYFANDVIGPDEYHEGFNNNAYTNYLIDHTFKVTETYLQKVGNSHPEHLKTLLEHPLYQADLADLSEIHRNLYLPQPDAQGIIPQFDGYRDLEDVSVKVVKTRIKHPNEYLGGPFGVVTPTQVIKQADLITMLALFPEKFDQTIQKINWQYYEPRTEHGSSLSQSMYALTATRLGMSDYAYPLFLRSATIDLAGDAKEYAGGIYIGGTHPAASGGAYLTAIYGFAGIRFVGSEIVAFPHLPAQITSLRFRIRHLHRIANITITHNQTKITYEETN